MSDYSLSEHPIWKVLDIWGLPPEIINIIYEICFFPLFKEMSFQFPNYISLFGVFPKEKCIRV